MFCKWDYRWMEMAKLVATFSKNKGTKVGAIIVGPSKKELISFGYNGAPPGFDDDFITTLPKEKRLKFMVHAEANAIRKTNRDLTGCLIYSTHYPCLECSKEILSNNFSTIVYAEDKWCNEGKEILKWAENLKVLKLINS
jgi:dCMP deaminase